MNIINVSPPHKTSIQHVIQPFRCAKSPLPLFSLLLFSASLLLSYLLPEPSSVMSWGQTNAQPCFGGRLAHCGFLAWSPHWF